MADKNAPGVHLDPDGTARIVLDDTTITLRRPKLAEYTDIIDFSSDLDHEIMALRPELVRLNDKIVKGTARDDDRASARDISRKVQMVKAPIVPMLAERLGGTTIDVDDLPVWAVADASKILSQLFSHWESAPFHGSGQNES